MTTGGQCKKKIKVCHCRILLRLSALGLLRFKSLILEFLETRFSLKLIIFPLKNLFCSFLKNKNSQLPNINRKLIVGVHIVFKHSILSEKPKSDFFFYSL